MFDRLGGGSSSRAVWLSATRPDPRASRTAEVWLLLSQPSTVPGRSVVARFSYRGSRSGRTAPSAPLSNRRNCSRRAQRRHGPSTSLAASPQPGQRFQNDGSEGVQAEHSGPSLLPARTGLTWPQRAHRAQRFWQARHHGSPVALETSQGAGRPQTEQAICFSGRQVSHSGPSGVRALTGRCRWQRVQASQLVGSRFRQSEQSGCPRSSRAPGSRTVPQRAQGTARHFATQFRHNRSLPGTLSSGTALPQCGQPGREMLVAPASHRASMRRSTEGTGASAPAPVSSSGRSWSAHASWRRWPAREVTTATAAATVS